MSVIITISGLHGTGKSTYADILSKKFGLRYFSAGEYFRHIVKQKKMSILEMSKVASKDERIDKMIDDKTREEAKLGNVVLDGMLTMWMVRDMVDLKIFLTASDEIRINRIAKRDIMSYEEAKETTFLREKIEKERFKKYYGIDIDNLWNYDLVLNTGLLSIEANIGILIKFIEEFLKNEKKNKK